ncbi:MAG: hypothetical protein WC763_02480 [Candidatus Paceibacterota bacterium]|jgi:hypothetical protein
MKRVQEIATELSKGNFKKASDIRKEISAVDGDSHELEIMEIARQAMITNLKRGSVSDAKEIERSFNLADDVVEETIEQAVMSSVYDGDIERLIKLKKELPITRDLGNKIVSYCASWGKKDRFLALEELFA